MLSWIAAIDAEGSLALDLSRERLAGYKDGLGSSWRNDYVRTCRPNASEPARVATVELLQVEGPPTAILAMSDVLAVGALQAAAELGIAVPADLSVVGFDDSPAAALASPRADDGGPASRGEGAPRGGVADRGD